MTIPVTLQEIPEKAASFGSSAYVITSGGTSSPRVTHVEVAFEGTFIKTALGKSASREIASNPHVTVLWSGDELSLIVDGRVDGEISDGGGEVKITPESAILHRRRTIK